MGAEQSRNRGREELPFKGVPSDQVGRGSGQDPPDMPDEDQPECEALQIMKREYKEEQQRGKAGGVSSGKRAGGSGSAGGDEPEIGSIQRPPADS